MSYSQDDLDAAVAEGAVSAEAASAFRAFVERRRSTTLADDEAFRLLTGFNDIFVSIAIVMVLFALGWLSVAWLAPATRTGQSMVFAVGGGAVAAVSWGLAEFFTRVRRMALPSILLLLSFVSGVAAVAAAAAYAFASTSANAVDAVVTAALVGVASGVAALVHWRRFKVPVTVAAGVFAVGVACVVVVDAFAASETIKTGAILLAGLIAFALAIWWDASDPARKTRRADVAFWLHLLAAPAIVHPVFALLGLTRLSAIGSHASPATSPPDAILLQAAVASVAIYAVLAFVALIVDRRALMVSGLLYLIYATNAALRLGGSPTLSFAGAGLIVGAGLLLLSAFWPAARSVALRLAPNAWRSRLPPAR